MLIRLIEPMGPEAKRLIVDVSIQEALGRFFARKLRAAVLYELSLKNGSKAPLDGALRNYREAWAATEQTAPTSTI